MQIRFYMLKTSGNLPIATLTKNLRGVITLSDLEGQLYSINRRVVQGGGTSMSQHYLSRAYNVRAFTK